MATNAKMDQLTLQERRVIARSLIANMIYLVHTVIRMQENIYYDLYVRRDNDVLRTPATVLYPYELYTPVFARMFYNRNT